MPRKSKAKANNGKKTAGPKRNISFGSTLRSGSAPAAVATTFTVRHQLAAIDPKSRVDCNTDGAVRMRGTAMYLKLCASSLTSSGLIDGGYWGSGLFLQFLSQFIHNLTDVYSWYRFRSVRLTYVPLLPTSAAGSVSIALSDADENGVLPASTYEIAGYEHSATTAVYQRVAIDYKYDGPRVWHCHQQTGSTAMERIQLYFFAGGQGIRPQGEATNWFGQVGEFIIDYDLEFYGPRTNLGSPTFALESVLRETGLTPETRNELEKRLKQAHERNLELPRLAPAPNGEESRPANADESSSSSKGTCRDAFFRDLAPGRR